MPTAAYDLINLNSLVLTDTFNTMYNRLNQVIDAVNPLQIYDVVPGVTGGLSADVNTSSGVVSMKVNPGPGIGTYNYGGQSRTIVDFALFDTYNLAATGASNGFYVQSNDEFIVNSVNDTSSGGRPSGTAKKVRASKMLPPVIDIPSISFTGDVTVGGNFTVLGNNSFIAANNLRIQDKQIELAYQESVSISLTGVTAGSFTVGATAWHFALNASPTADLLGHVISYTGPVAGPTGTLVLGYPFGTGQNASMFVGVTGYLANNEVGIPRRSIGTTIGSPSTQFLSDSNLSDAGFVAYGASGNKTFLWTYNDADSGQNVNAWIANTNLGVVGANSAILSRYFRSYGYTGVSTSQFVFVGENGDTELYFAQNGTDTSTISLTGHIWKITRSQSVKDLVFSYGSSGDVNSVSELFRIVGGASGTTFPGVTASNFAKSFNSDMLDGAHGYQTSTPYSIPIANAYGRIDGGWLESSAISRTYTITGNTFVVGNVVRITSTGAFDLAYANDEQHAEAVGMVGSVNGNDVYIVNEGRITGLSGAVCTVDGVPLVAGNAYFLAGATSNAGKLIADPDNGAYRLQIGQVRKPMLLAVSESEGYVYNYLGAKIPTPTDEIYLSGLVPVGAIYPYAGGLENINLGSEWLLCDGDRYRAVDFSDLYATIGTRYSTQITFANNGLTGTISRGVRNLQIGDNILVGASAAAIAALSEANSTLTLSIPIVAGTYEFNVSTNSSNETLFFVPDLRTRVPVGGSTGDSAYTYGNLTNYEIGDFGGSETVSLTASNLPSHSHGMGVDYTYAASGIAVAVGPGTDINTSATGAGSAVDVRNPYLAVNYIIRASATTLATVLTGHDHDNRYIRYDASQSGLVLADRDRFRTNASVAGQPLGSLTSGDYHDHDLRHLRIDATGQGLSTTGQYYGRINLNASPVGEGDGHSGLGSGQTNHNHDNIYVRFDTEPQAVFGTSEKAYFRTKIGAISNLGGDMAGALNISGPINFVPGSGTITGLTSPSSADYAANKYYVDRYCVVNQTFTGSGSGVLSGSLTYPSNFPSTSSPSRIKLNFLTWNNINAGVLSGTYLNSADITFRLDGGAETISIPMFSGFAIVTITPDFNYPYPALTISITTTSGAFTLGASTIIRTTWYE